MRSIVHSPMLRVFWFWGIGLLAGWILISHIDVRCIVMWGLILFISGGVLVMIPGLHQHFPSRWRSGVLLAICLVGLGCFRLGWHQYEIHRIPLKVADNDFTGMGYIKSDPKAGGRWIKAELQVERVFTESGWKAYDFPVFIYWPLQEHEKIQVGSRLVFRGKWAPVLGIPLDHHQSIQRYAWTKGIQWQIYIPDDGQWLVCSENQTGISLMFKRLRTRLYDILQTHIPDQTNAGLAGSLILGYRVALDPSLREVYSQAGTMHVLAVSGLHVGIILMIISFLMKSIGLSPDRGIPACLLCIVAVWMFALLTGGSASALRAAFMCSLYQLGKVSKQPVSIFNTMAATAFVLTFFKPTLIFDIGFQLSFAAVWGIVVFQPRLWSLWIPQFQVSKYLWTMITVSAAAQLGTLPLQSYYFHQFPTYFLMANVWAIPMAFFILCGGLILLVLHPFPYLPIWLGYALNAVIHSQNVALEYLTKLPHSVLPVYINGLGVILMFLLLMWLWSRWLSKPPFQAIATVIILSLSYFLWMKWDIRFQTQFCVHQVGLEDIYAYRHHGQWYYWVPHSSNKNSLWHIEQHSKSTGGTTGGITFYHPLQKPLLNRIRNADP